MRDERSIEDMDEIATLDMKQTSFFDHRDLEMARRLSGFKLPV